jgi:hypothetical protein
MRGRKHRATISSSLIARAVIPCLALCCLSRASTCNDVHMVQHAYSVMYASSSNAVILYSLYSSATAQMSLQQQPRSDNYHDCCTPLNGNFHCCCYYSYRYNYSYTALLPQKAHCRAYHSSDKAMRIICLLVSGIHLQLSL